LGSVCKEVHFIKPDAIGLLLIVPVHLEGDIDFFLEPVRLCRVISVHRVALICHGQINVVHLIADPLEMPDEMNPSRGREVVARYRCRFPDLVQWIPNLPVVSIVEIALRSPSPANAWFTSNSRD